MNTKSILEPNNQQESPLSLAFRNQRFDIVELYMRSNDPELKQALAVCFAKFALPGQNLLKHAVQTGKIQLLKMLINLAAELGIDLAQKDALGNTLLHIASQYGQLEIVKILLTPKEEIHAGSLPSEETQDIKHTDPMEKAPPMMRRSFTLPSPDHKTIPMEKVIKNIE